MNTLPPTIQYFRTHLMLYLLNNLLLQCQFTNQLPNHNESSIPNFKIWQLHRNIRFSEKKSAYTTKFKQSVNEMKRILQISSCITNLQQVIFKNRLRASFKLDQNQTYSHKEAFVLTYTDILTQEPKSQARQLISYHRDQLIIQVHISTWQIYLPSIIHCGNSKQ